MIVTKKIAREMVDVFEEIKKEISKQNNESEKKYPFSEWEKKREKVKEKLRRLPDYVKKAASMIRTEDENKAGRPEKIQNLSKKTMLFLFARLMNKSNRDAEEVLELFQPLFEVEVSYKYIERLYSDKEVSMVLHNLFILLLQDEDISGNFSGDGTGYSFTVTRHYRSDPKKSGKKYGYAFRMIDLDTGMYVGFGYSNKSEKEAFDKAIEMIKDFGIEMDSVTLDKYYSSGKILKIFGEKTKVYAIPKKNISKIGFEWSRVIKRIIENPFDFMKTYFKRNLSESGFSSDKRRFGWIIRQRREDRKETAMFTTTLLHNIFFVRVKVS